MTIYSTASLSLVIGFGSSFKRLYQKSKVYDDTTLENAIKHVNKMKAGKKMNGSKAPFFWISRC